MSPGKRQHDTKRQHDCGKQDLNRRREQGVCCVCACAESWSHDHHMTTIKHLRNVTSVTFFHPGLPSFLPFPSLLLLLSCSSPLPSFPRSLGWQQRNRSKVSKDSLTRHSNSLHWMTVKMTLRRTQKIVSTMVKVVGAPQRQGREWLTLTPLYLFESHGANQVHPLLSVTES